MNTVTAWIVLNIVDFYLTWLAISLGAKEANVVMQVFNVDNVPEIAFWKIAFVFGTIVFLEVINKPKIMRPAIVLGSVNHGMLIICIWNAFMLQITVAGIV
ncbi:MAG: hypothetical protein GY834_01550 [Bacteroidetes bacterium]|nr:hypothetical protein [Bacteroidota bacterium]